MLEFFPGDLIDARFNMYILEHGYRFFTGQVHEFWNAPFMYPEKDVVTYSDNFLGSVPFYIFFRLFGFGATTSFQLWFLFITALNFAASYFFLNSVFKNRMASALGAMIFTFALSLQSQMGHAQTYCRFPIPLAFYFGFRFTDELNPKFFFMMLLIWVYQTYCSFYTGLMLLVPLSLFVVVMWVIKRKVFFKSFKTKFWFIQMLSCLAANILFLLPLVMPYFSRARELGFYDFNFIVRNVPTFVSYFFSWNGSLFWDLLNSTGLHYPNFWDHQIFAGGLATLCLLLFSASMGLSFSIAFAKWKTSVQLNALFVAFLITFVFYLRVDEKTLYFFINKIPGFGSMRAVQRIINVELLMYAVATSWVFSKLFSSQKPNYNQIFFIAVVVLCIADNYVKEGYVHQHRKDDSEKRVNALAEKMKLVPENEIISYEPDSLTSAPMDYQLDAMLASQITNHVCMNGYSATSPGGFGDYWINPNEKNRNYWLERKGMKNVKVTVVK